MSIYQLKSKDYYMEKSLGNENFRKNIFSSMVPRTDIFLIDEYFSPISVITKDSDYLKVNIYKINKDDYETRINLKDRNMYDMTIICEKFVTSDLTGYSKHARVYTNQSVINFLNSYLDSDTESRKIKRIRDRMTFLRYSIEYK